MQFKLPCEHMFASAEEMGLLGANTAAWMNGVVDPRYRMENYCSTLNSVSVRLVDNEKLVPDGVMLHNIPVPQVSFEYIRLNKVVWWHLMT